MQINNEYCIPDEVSEYIKLHFKNPLLILQCVKEMHENPWHYDTLPEPIENGEKPTYEQIKEVILLDGTVSTAWRKKTCNGIVIWNTLGNGRNKRKLWKGVVRWRNLPKPKTKIEAVKDGTYYP